MISARVDISAASRFLIGLRNPDLRKAFREAQGPARRDTRDHAKTQEGPDGAWPRLSPFTVAKYARTKRRRSRKLLGRLPAALKMIPSRNGLIVRSRPVWGGAQNDGGTVGHGTKLPERKYLWPSDALMSAVGMIVERHLQKLADK